MYDQIGQEVGNYRLVRLIGQGSFGSVYLAEHRHLQMQAAVKLLRQQVEADEQDAFLQEARMIASLKHTNILRVLDFGFEQGMPYLVTEYAPNGTLRQKHSRGSRIPLTIVLPYTQQIARGLQYAHDRELIHRDIKPENVLFDEDKRIVLSDFGIALVGSRHLTEKDIAGTATYMAPEQFQGKPRRASDQYALGIMVYEWLTGKPPFQGDFYGLAGQHIASHVPPPEQVPSEVATVVLKALEKVPEDRFSTVTAFADALEQAIKSVQGKEDQTTHKTQQDHEKEREPVTLQSSKVPSPTVAPTNGMATTQKTSPLPRYGFWYAFVSGIIAGFLIFGFLLSTYSSSYRYFSSPFVVYLILWAIVTCCIAGFVTGKIAAAWKMGWITGGGVSLSFAILTVITPKFYAPEYSAPLGVIVAEVMSIGLIGFLFAVPFIFCGMWLAIRNHSYYRSK